MCSQPVRVQAGQDWGLASKVKTFLWTEPLLMGGALPRSGVRTEWTHRLPVGVGEAEVGASSCVLL